MSWHVINGGHQINLLLLISDKEYGSASTNLMLAVLFEVLNVISQHDALVSACRSLQIVITAVS